MKKSHPSLILRIPEPCNVSDDFMTPTNDGQFCSQCSRELIDFTDFSDLELIAHFRHTKGNLCGTFSKEQLNRELVPAPFSKPHFQHLSLPALALLAMTMTTQISYGQTPDTVKTEIIQTAVPVPVPAIATHAPGTDTLFGNVYSRKKIEGLRNVRVTLMSGDTVLRIVKTDAAGNFTCVLLPGESADIILVDKRDYYQRKIDLRDNPHNLNEPLNIRMQQGLTRRQLKKRRNIKGRLAIY